MHQTTKIKCSEHFERAADCPTHRPALPAAREQAGGRPLSLSPLSPSQSQQSSLTLHTSSHTSPFTSFEKKVGFRRFSHFNKHASAKILNLMVAHKEPAYLPAYCVVPADDGDSMYFDYLVRRKEQ